VRSNDCGLKVCCQARQCVPRHIMVLSIIISVSKQVMYNADCLFMAGHLYVSNSLCSTLEGCFKDFYPRDAMLARVIEIATCLSVRPSRAGIVSKRRKLAA